MLTKIEIREKILNIRKNLDSYFLNLLNEKLYNNFLNNVFLNSFTSKKIAGYSAIDEECNVNNILKYYSKNNKIFLPCIDKKDSRMVFRNWNCCSEDLEINNIFKKFKLFEPKNYCYPDVPDIVFVPALAVDLKGNRVGYGKGYYDRTLANMDCIKIATVFDFQVMEEEIENNYYDIGMDYILTEDRFICI